MAKIHYLYNIAKKIQRFMLDLVYPTSNINNHLTYYKYQTITNDANISKTTSPTNSYSISFPCNIIN